MWSGCGQAPEADSKSGSVEELYKPGCICRIKIATPLYNKFRRSADGSNYTILPASFDGDQQIPKHVALWTQQKGDSRAPALTSWGTLNPQEVEPPRFMVRSLCSRGLGRDPHGRPSPSILRGATISRTSRPSRGVSMPCDGRKVAPPLGFFDNIYCLQ